MSFSYFWPIILVVICNTFYQIFAKGIPADMDTMASMTVTYFVATITSACLFFIMKHGGSLAQEYSKMNYAPPLLGVAIVGLEVGFIYAYKIGWPVSSAQLIANSILAVVLIFVGVLLYHEAISVKKVVGILICLVGLYFIKN